MNPFNNLGFFPEVKSSFNYNDLINNTFHIIEKEENEENKNPVELPIFKYTIKKCLETFDTLNLKGFSPNHFSDIVQRHHKESDFKGHHDLLINAQLFELELFKLASLLLIVEEKDDINSSYKKQLINTIENVVRYNKVFNIDNTQFASKLYSHLYERHSKHHDIINQIRDTFLKNKCFF